MIQSLLASLKKVNVSGLVLNLISAGVAAATAAHAAGHSVQTSAGIGAGAAGIAIINYLQNPSASSAE